jgi:hypothetical protein
MRMPAFYIVLQKKISGFDGTALEGRALSKHSAQIDTLAKKAGVSPLINFFSADADEIADLVEEPNPAARIPNEKWFSADEGLKTIAALLKSLKAKSAENSALMRELNEFQRVLEAAESRNIRWHLAIDY